MNDSYNNEPLVSIIIPVYNAEKQIGTCLDSIIQQTYKNLQIILIDDGSTDNSFSMIQEYVKDDSRIVCIQQENQGSVSARKRGLDIAVGDYIEFVDADDYIENDTVSELVRIMQDEKVDFVQFGFKTSAGSVLCAEHDNLIVIDPKDIVNMMNKTIMNQNHILFSLWSKLFEAQMIKNALMAIDNEQNYGEDFLCLCHYLPRAKRIYITSKVFYHYNIIEGSLSHGGWLKTIYYESTLYKEVVALLKEKQLEECIETYRAHYEGNVTYLLENTDTFAIHRNTYLLGEINRLYHKKIVIYGAGKVGKDYYYQAIFSNCCRVVAWVDKKNKDEFNVQNPNVLMNLDFDLLIIAVKDKDVALQIRNELLVNRLVENSDKIIWIEPQAIKG